MKERNDESINNESFTTRRSGGLLPPLQKLLPGPEGEDMAALALPVV